MPYHIFISLNKKKNQNLFSTWPQINPRPLPPFIKNTNYEPLENPELKKEQIKRETRLNAPSHSDRN